MGDEPRYCSYLLRLWLTTDDDSGKVIWRASLEDPHSGERRGFASLEALFDYLNRQTRQKNKPEEGIQS